MNFIIQILVNAVVVFIAAYLMKGVEVKNFLHAILVALVLALLNAFVKPIFLFFTLPVNILTLGLFTWVINAVILMIADWILAGFKIHGFWWALGLAIIMAILNSVFGMVI